MSQSLSANTPPRIVRLPDVLKRTQLSRSTIYNFINSGSFPSPVKLGARAMGFFAADIDAWILSRVGASILNVKLSGNPTKRTAHRFTINDKLN